MMKAVTLGAGAVGGGILVYVSRNYWGQDLLALGIVGLIGLGFVAGLRELWRHGKALGRYRSELAGLEEAEGPLEEAPDFRDLSEGLRRVLRGRLGGQSVQLSPPTGTSYLLGLLVMLGLLGTFLGMVDTLQGARAVLAGSNEIVTMREGLVAPIMGLSRAFGTSVAGVSCSALLGLVAVLATRDRLELKRSISRLLSTSLYRWTVAGRQETMLTALTTQLAAIPETMSDFERLTQSMGALSERLVENQEQLAERLVTSSEVVAKEMGEGQERLTSRLVSEQAQLSERLVTSQEALAMQAGEMLERVTSGVTQTMEKGTRYWVEHSTEELKPLLSAAVLDVAASTQTHFEGWAAALEEHGERGQREQENWRGSFKGMIEELVETLKVQEAARFQTLNGELKTLIGEFNAGLLGLGEESRGRLERFETTVAGFEGSMETLLAQICVEHEGLGAKLVDLSGEFHRQQAGLEASFGVQVQELGAHLTAQLGEIETLQVENQVKALKGVESLDEVVSLQLEQLGAKLGESLQGVVESAEKAPRAAAEVLTSLQARVEEQIGRENLLVQERAELMDGLSEVVTGLRDAAESHQAVIRSMSERAEEELKQVGESTRGELATARTDIVEAATLIGVGGHEMAALTEMFGASVDEYRGSNDRLLEGLEKIEGALGRVGERSDQQLSLYVSQAREILDHSMLSQKEVFDELRLLRVSKAPVEDNV